MAKPKNLEQLRAEKEQVETQLAQEQHIWSSTALQGSLPSVYPANCILTLLTWTNRQRKGAALSLSR